jgi:4,5-DOPA dioxygenase extradiol
MSQPTLFISHGAPNLALKPQHPARRFLKNLGRELARPGAVVVVSAHWGAGRPTISAVDRHITVRDFGNFDSL